MTRPALLCLLLLACGCSGPEHSRGLSGTLTNEVVS